MDVHDLPAIATKAIDHLLSYHDRRHLVLTVPEMDVIKDRVEALLPLKSLAADPDVANIEIVADAAMSFADYYNLEHMDKPISHKWLYIGVQTLASVDLKPALVHGDVSRLQATSIETQVHSDNTDVESVDLPSVTERNSDEAGVEPRDLSQSDEIKAHAEYEASVVDHEPPATPASSDDAKIHTEQLSPDDNWSPTAKNPRSRKRRSSGPPVSRGKDPWADEEIEKLIKWKCRGLTHKEAGARLGRTEPACAIRHSIVLKQPKWLKFARAYREKRAAGVDSSAEDENESAGEDEQVEEDENMEGESSNVEQITGVGEAK